MAIQVPPDFYQRVEQQIVLQSRRITVDDVTAVMLLPQNPYRVGAVIKNPVGAQLGIGSKAGVIGGDSHILGTNDAISLVTSAEVWGIFDAGGSGVVSVIEEVIRRPQGA